MTRVESPGVALVTGAGRGIGRGCALALARAGHFVVSTDVNESTAALTHAAIADEGGHSAAFALDVTDEAGWARVVTTVEAEHGPVTSLVNNAGLKASLAPGDRGLLDMDLATWDRMMTVNLRGPMLGARAVLPSMLAAGKGAIVNISSTAALRSSPDLATAYSSAKAGLLGFTRSVAVTYATRGIRCNAIAPGVTITDESDPGQQDFAASTRGLLPRVGTPFDIGDTVAFLCGDKGSYVNGQVIVVDGGLIVHLPALSSPTLTGSKPS